MAVPLGSRAPAMTVLGPPRYTSRRAAAGRYAAAIAVFDAIITFQPTEPSCRERSSIACKTVSSSPSAPPTALSADMRKTPAWQRASNSGRGMWRSCSPASRHCAMIGARVRTRLPHALVLTAVFVVMDTAPFCLHPSQGAFIAVIRDVTPHSSLCMTHTRAQYKKNLLDRTIRVLYSPRQHEWHECPQCILVTAALALFYLRACSTLLCCSPTGCG